MAGRMCPEDHGEGVSTVDIGNATNQGWWIDSAESDQWHVTPNAEYVKCERCGAYAPTYDERATIGGILIAMKLHRDECEYFTG